jgi:hypothetical protein
VQHVGGERETRGLAAQHRLVQQVLRDHRLAQSIQTSDILPILNYSRSRSVIAFTRDMVRGSALFANMGFAANGHTLSNNVMER